MKKENSKSNKKITQVLLNVPNELNEKYKLLAGQQGVPKSYLFMTALNYYLDYKDIIKSMPKMIEALNSHSQKTQDNQDNKE